MSWLDTLLGGIKTIYDAGTAKPLRAGLNFTGATVTDNAAADRLDIAFAGAVASSTLPVSVGTAAIGAGTTYARHDHVHAHGNQAAGGTLHAAATGSVAGFMPAADKALVDTATSAATALALARRGASAECAFGALTAPSLVSAAALSLGATATATSVLGSTITQDCATLTWRDAGGQARCARAIAAAYTCTYDPSVTSVVDSITKPAGTGVVAGAPRSLASQDGQNVAAGTNNSGGNLVLRGGAVGTGGTGGSNGSVTIGTGAIDRIQCLGSGVTIDASGTLAVTGDQTVTGSLFPSGQLIQNVNAVSFAASTTLDARNGNHHRVAAMTANITTLDMSNAVAGAEHTVEVLQDATGSRTVTWAAKFIFSAEFSAVPLATANSRTIYKFLVRTSTDIRIIGKATYTT